MELIKHDKQFKEIKWRVDPIREAKDYNLYHLNNKKLDTLLNDINNALINHHQYYLFIDMVNMYKKAKDMKEFCDMLLNIKTEHKKRYINGGSEVLEHWWLIVNKHKYLIGETKI